MRTYLSGVAVKSLALRGLALRGVALRGLALGGLALGGLALASPTTPLALAAAEPLTIADCEKIQAADAYNQCLAKFGPESKIKNLEPERPNDVKNNSAEAAASAGKPKGRGHVRRGGGHRHAATGSGRKRATFSVPRRKK